MNVIAVLRGSIAPMAGALVLSVLSVSADAAAFGRRPPNVVSMIDLLANKEKFNGKLVQVSGFLSWQFEDHALYLDENAYSHTFTENALWIEPDGTERMSFEKYDRHPGYVIGVFSVDNCNGHLCLYGGKIVEAKLGLMFKER
ncbi:MAG TPA: hypothetical protein VHW69_16525 [Rhizomicrobium sp.]|jgi:hypothetical protein|nr:hypothetical protein [Rhizomicrobium sp.]